MTRIVIWDVQHGSAAYIRTPTGKHIVIDLGVGSFKNPTDATFSPLAHLHWNYQIIELDALIITHPHRDHLDDINNVALVRPKAVFAPRHLTEEQLRAGNPAYDTDAVMKAYRNLLAQYSSPLTLGIDPRNRTLTGLDVQIFSPFGYTGTNLNNHSIVTVLSYAGSKILIPGDNESPSWAELLKQPAFVAAITGTDILVAAHHGREAGYSQELFNFISPKLVIVSDTTNPGTSAVDKYSAKASGWLVRNRTSGEYETRYCLTTRSDDYIVIDMYADDGQNYLTASVE
jgi:competence protein ComEC